MICADVEKRRLRIEGGREGVTYLVGVGDKMEGFLKEPSSSVTRAAGTTAASYTLVFHGTRRRIVRDQFAQSLRHKSIEHFSMTYLHEPTPTDASRHCNPSHIPITPYH